MPPRKKNKATGSAQSPSNDPPAPFKRPSPSLDMFMRDLSPRNIYIAHLDKKPANFKRKIFLVPMLTNLGVAVFLAYRAQVAIPYYFSLLTSLFGHYNETTFPVQSSTWGQIAWAIFQRFAMLTCDFVLLTMVAPTVLGFVARGDCGNPATWRFRVGFRESEICVRRSRDWAHDMDGDVVSKLGGKSTADSDILETISQATSPTLLAEKTSYVLMNSEWLLDFASMVKATQLVDKGALALEEFGLVVLLHDKQYGWLTLDTAGPGTGSGSIKDERQRQLFAFRDALAAVGKEELFYRWVEMMQFESTHPNGFGPERQAKAAEHVREMFSNQGVDFDQFWVKSVGSDHLAGMT